MSNLMGCLLICPFTSGISMEFFGVIEEGKKSHVMTYSKVEGLIAWEFSVSSSTDVLIFVIKEKFKGI